MNKIFQLPSRHPRIHFVGIGGIGMAGLAQILRSRGYRVTGSDDVRSIFMTDEILRKNKIRFKNFSAKNITKNIDLIIASTAYLGPEARNAEIERGRKLNIPMQSYPAALSGFFNESRGIGIAGSHGKTTTTALCGVIFQRAGLRPTALVGGEVKQWKSNVLTPNPYTPIPDHFFIIEADEYRNAFLHYRPEAAIITSVDFDHPDVFTRKSYRAAFEKFISNIRDGGILICCGDDKILNQIANRKAQGARLRIFTYGFNKSNTYQVKDAGIHGGLQHFQIRKNDQALHFSMLLPGRGYILDAAAAAILALQYGIPERKIKNALMSFSGVKRRFDFILQKKNAPWIFDDYGHHPGEIKNTVEALERMYPEKKIFVCFQPHTFSRTKALFSDFTRVLLKMKHAISLLEIYGSAREKGWKISSKNLVNELARKGKRAIYFKSVTSAENHYKRLLKSETVLACVGAGDGPYRLARSLARHYNFRRLHRNMPRRT